MFLVLEWKHLANRVEKGGSRVRFRFPSTIITTSTQSAPNMESNALRHPAKSGCYGYLLHTSSTSSGVEIYATDAAPTGEPAQIRRSENVDGTIDIFDLSPDKDVRHWKHRIGRFIAEHVLRSNGGLPTLPPDESFSPSNLSSSSVRVPDTEQCVLLDFPEGYKLYTHATGNRYDPRKDCYLMGESTGRDLAVLDTDYETLKVRSSCTNSVLPLNSSCMPHGLCK